MQNVSEALNELPLSGKSYETLLERNKSSDQAKDEPSAKAKKIPYHKSEKGLNASKRYRGQFTKVGSKQKLSELPPEKHEEFLKKLNKYQQRNRRSTKKWVQSFKERMKSGEETEKDKEYVRKRIQNERDKREKIQMEKEKALELINSKRFGQNKFGYNRRENEIRLANKAVSIQLGTTPNFMLRNEFTSSATSQ